MTPEDIRRVVLQVLQEERRENEEKLDTTVLKTLSAILTGFGIESDERADIKEDFRYLRKWRKGSDRLTGVGLTAIVTVMVGGLLSAIYIGIKTMLGKG